MRVLSISAQKPDGTGCQCRRRRGRKLFIEWLFSSDDNLHDLADIDKKTTLLLALPTVSGIELDFDTSQLMEEDLTKFGSAREVTLAKWDKVTSGKEVVSSK